MQSNDNSIGTAVLRASDSYLVSIPGEADREVQIASDGLICSCLEAQLSDDGSCGHIHEVQAVSVGSDQELPIISQALADAYLAKVVEIDQTIAMNKVSASEQIARIQSWLDQENAKCERRKSFYLTALESWLYGNELKSKNLVHGKIMFRKQQPEIEILDEQAVLSDERFARVIPVKHTIDKSALRKHVVSTGEEIEGICVNLKEPKFSYKSNE